MNINQNLDFSEFPKPTYDQWKNEAIKSLKGADFEKKLFSQTLEGILLLPIYNMLDLDNLPYLSNHPGVSPYLRGNYASGTIARKWEIAQSIPFSNHAEFNSQLRQALANGQDAITININRHEYYQFFPLAVNCGTKFIHQDDLSAAFDGINLEDYPIYFNAGDIYSEFAPLFIDYLNSKEYDLTKIKGNIGADPFGEILINGGSKYSVDHLISSLAETISILHDSVPNYGAITLNGAFYYNAGATAVQELAFSFANLIDLITKLSQYGLQPHQIFPKIRLHFSVSSDFFMNIAKLRAARVLWAKLAEAYGLDATYQKVKIHSSTSMRDKTKLDPYVNILRNSIAGLSAILGNSESIDIGNFDFAYGHPSELSLRISRNTQLVLLHEAHLNDTIDPVSGSYYIESLTNDLINSAWKLFLDIDTSGGFWNAIQSGNIQSLIADSANIIDQSYQTRRSTLLGTNKYPILKQKLPTDNPPYQFKDIAFKELTPKITEVQSIKITRFAYQFELLRDNASKFEQITGALPQILMLNFGEVNEWKPRNDFALDFLQVAGFDCIQSPAFNSYEDAMIFFIDQSCPNSIAICSSDAKYESLLPELSFLIKKYKPMCNIILAGYPEGMIDEYKSYGIDHFVHLKANIFETLSDIQKYSVLPIIKERN